MSVTISGSVSVLGAANMDPGFPISATAGTTTSISVATGVAVSFSVFASVTGGNSSSYVYSISSGTLPAGLTLNSAVGVVSGIPTTSQNAASVTFTVSDAFGQQATTTSTVSFTILGPYTVTYLVVAGGGGGGGGNNGNSQGAGAGGGGLLQGTATMRPGTAYTITVGGGGAGGAGVSGATPTNPGAAGANSSVSGACFSTLLARGGGGGGGANLNSPVAQPANGGSGGGGYGMPSSGSNTNATAFGSPGYNVAGTQGYPGGSSGPRSFPIVQAGGGGAGGTGSNQFGCCSAPPFGGFGTGNGGAGYTWPFTGTTYAGGGGGGNYNKVPQAIYGIGGPGGGGNGGAGCGATNRNTGCGTLNTGGGGGGGGLAGATNFTGGTGGSGVVILAVPTPVYPSVVATGAAVSTPPSAPGLTVLTYTSPSRTVPATFTFTA